MAHVEEFRVVPLVLEIFALIASAGCWLRCILTLAFCKVAGFVCSPRVWWMS